jgi:6-phosphofructokinase 2
VFSCGGEGYYAPRIPIEALSTVGAGDCMVAGMLYALQHNMPPKEVFRYAVAGGTAGCMTPGTMLLRRDDFFTMAEKVELVAINNE